MRNSLNTDSLTPLELQAAWVVSHGCLGTVVPTDSKLMLGTELVFLTSKSSWPLLATHP